MKSKKNQKSKIKVAKKITKLLIKRKKVALLQTAHMWEQESLKNLGRLLKHREKPKNSFAP